MIFSELKVLGIYFAYKTDSQYLITEEIIDEYEKKKPILKRNKEIINNNQILDEQKLEE